MSVDLKTFIKRALAEKRNVEIGKFNLLNLNDVRESAGDNWPNLKKRIFEAGAHFIEKRLGPNDAVITCNEGFILLFANPEMEIGEEVAAIADEMKLFFLGQPDLAHLRLATETLKADANGIGALIATGKPAAPASPGRARKEIPQTRATDDEPGGIRAFFRPIWDAERQCFVANFCFAKINIEGRWSEFRRARQLRMTSESHADADIATLSAAIQALRFASQKKQRQTLALGVHQETLDDRQAFARWSELLTALPDAARRKFWIRVDEMPEHPDEARPYLEKLADLNVTVIAERPFADTELEPFSDMAVELFGMTTRAPSNAESEGLLDHELKQLNLFARAASEHQAGTFLDDIREARTFKDVMATGVRFLAGADVLKASPIPSPLRPFSMVDLARLSKVA